MENEPPTPQMLQKMSKQKNQDQQFWDKIKKQPKPE
jgi:hypothetical protein